MTFSFFLFHISVYLTWVNINALTIFKSRNYNIHKIDRSHIIIQILVKKETELIELFKFIYQSHPLFNQYLKLNRFNLFFPPPQGIYVRNLSLFYCRMKQPKL